jgi:mannitol/fructose-specific phosphotransferase system IIA component (Ntr-type)
MSRETHSAWKLFRPAACTVKLRATAREELFDELVGNLVKAEQLDPDRRAEALEALLARERLASTGIGAGVAVPHVMLEGLERAIGSLSVHPAGIAWQAIDGAPVHLFFTVLRPASALPDHDPQRHLDTMRWISRLARHEDFRRFALSARNRTELVDLLREMAAL